MNNQEVFLLEQQLNQVKLQLDEFAKAHILNNEVWSLFEQQRKLERELSLAKGMETALLIDYPYPWDIGAPLPHVVANGYKTFLMYHIGVNNPVWKSNTQKVTTLDSAHDDIIALVEFTRCYIYKFGGINDEVIGGHRLSGHGLEEYEAHIIENSAWIKEQTKINCVHSNHSQVLWDQRKHYLFTFHDEVFECIAAGYKVDVFKGSIHSVYAEATNRLFA